MTQLATLPLSRTLSALALAALPGLAALPAYAEDIPGSDFSSGLWAGRAWEDGGKFVDCYVGVSYTNGENLTLSLTPDDGLTVYLSAPGVTFKPGQDYAAALMTEVGLPITGTAYAPNENYIGFTIAGIDAGMDYLTQGSYLRLYGIGIDQAFDVRGMGGALAHAKACMAAQTEAPKTAAAAPAKPKPPLLGSGGNGVKPAQMTTDIATFKRQHMPCKDADCK